MKKLLCIVFVAVGCGSSQYKAPPAVASVALPDGAQLKPFDPSRPGHARPEGMAQLDGKVYVAVVNYDSANYTAAGPGFLAAIVPGTGAMELIDLGGADGQQCRQPGAVRAFGANLYVTCAGLFDGSTGSIVELDAAGAVKRAVHVDGAPTQLTATSSKIWFGDAFGSTVRSLDRASFTQTPDAIALDCKPAAGGNGYTYVADLAQLDGDVYALCAADAGGTSTVSRLDAASGATKASVAVGPLPISLAATGDGRLAVLVAGDNTLRLVTPKPGGLDAAVALTYGSQTSTLNEVRARDGFLYTTASGSNTVQKIDLHAAGGAKVIGEVNVGQGANPWSILPLDDDQALVTNWLLDDVVSVRWQ